MPAHHKWGISREGVRAPRTRSRLGRGVSGRAVVISVGRAGSSEAYVYMGLYGLAVLVIGDTGVQVRSTTTFGTLAVRQIWCTRGGP